MQQQITAEREKRALIAKSEGERQQQINVAEQYIHQFGQLAKTNNTMIVPSNLSDVASVVASAMTVIERTRAGIEKSA